jgi:hypothetical protein
LYTGITYVLDIILPSMGKKPSDTVKEHETGSKNILDLSFSSAWTHTFGTIPR